MLFRSVTIALGFIVKGIDNAAHIGGLVAGAVMGEALARPLAAGSPVNRRVKWIALLTYAAAVPVLLRLIPEPTYSWQEEKLARVEIRHFMDEEKRLMERWQGILNKSRQRGASFEQLANEIESDIAAEYRQNFEQLSALHLDPAAPSNETLEVLKKYAQLRSEASQALAEALRDNDTARIREALEMARRAPYIARGQQPPTPGAPIGSVLDLYGTKPQIDFGQRQERPSKSP